MNIIQKDIVGFEGIYKVSEFGNIVRITNTQNNRWKAGHILKPFITYNGYHRVQLFKNNKHKYVFVHRIVAMAFIPNHHHKPYINHIDGNKINNHISNLEWCTHSENILHDFNVLGRIAYGRKLSDDDVVIIRKRYFDGENLTAISKDYNVSIVALNCAVLGKTYKKAGGKILRKGQKGSGNGSAKLTENQAREIKKRYKNENIMYKDLAKDYNVSPTTISRICNGSHWKHI